MSLVVFEAACVVVVALALALMARRRPARDLLADYAALAVAGWIGEETCVAFYGYYRYADGWHLRLHHVPILVPLIWPLVILSARDVAMTLWPSARRFWPLIVGAVVAFDASLVEVVAVRARLWSWAEPGHLGVPIIGMLGWGYFAIGADAALGRGRRLLAVVAAPAAAHALIQLTWWGGFRWGLRRDLGSASVLGVAVLGGLSLLLVLSARRRGGGIPMDVAIPRMVAASLFFTLLVTTAPADVPLWIHTAAVAVPYLAATRYARELAVAR
ncbi:Hypothetical protein A7982_02686 [Minicystis rosea]|nr:Hypothetical protein A7982_02686 [Minicystis rosea]